MHIRVHTSLPGPMTHGNALADSLVGSIHVTETTQFHSLTLINAGGLWARFPITYKQSWRIVQTCPTCQIINAPQESLEGVNPWGLVPNTIWQMDVTQVLTFWRLSFVHVSVDTASDFLVATAQTGETMAHSCHHLLVCFSIWDSLKQLKWTMALLILAQSLLTSVNCGKLIILQEFLTIYKAKALLNVLMPL